MEILYILKFLEQGGFLAVSAFLLYLIKKQSDRIEKFEKERKEENAEHKKDHEKLSAKIEDICKDYAPKEDHKLLAAKVESLECEYVPKGEFFQDVSGWRGDVQRLFERVEAIAKGLAYMEGRFDKGTQKV